MIHAGDRITELRDGVVAIHTIMAVSRRGGVYTCTLDRGTLRLRDAVDDVTSADREWSSYRRTVDGDEAALAATTEQIRAVLAAWPTAAPPPATPPPARD